MAGCCRWSLCSWLGNLPTSSWSWIWQTPSTMLPRLPLHTSLQQLPGRASWTGRSLRCDVPFSLPLLWSSRLLLHHLGHVSLCKATPRFGIVANHLLMISISARLALPLTCRLRQHNEVAVARAGAQVFLLCCCCSYCVTCPLRYLPAPIHDARK